MRLKYILNKCILVFILLKCYNKCRPTSQKTKLILYPHGDDVVLDSLVLRYCCWFLFEMPLHISPFVELCGTEGSVYRAGRNFMGLAVSDLSLVPFKM